MASTIQRVQCPSRGHCYSDGPAVYCVQQGQLYHCNSHCWRSRPPSPMIHPYVNLLWSNWIVWPSPVYQSQAGPWQLKIRPKQSLVENICPPDLNDVKERDKKFHRGPLCLNLIIFDIPVWFPLCLPSADGLAYSALLKNELLGAGIEKVQDPQSEDRRLQPSTPAKRSLFSVNRLNMAETFNESLRVFLASLMTLFAVGSIL